MYVKYFKNCLDLLGSSAKPDLAEFKAGALCDREGREGKRWGQERGGEESREKEKGSEGKGKEGTCTIAVTGDRCPWMLVQILTHPNPNIKPNPDPNPKLDPKPELNSKLSITSTDSLCSIYPHSTRFTSAHPHYYQRPQLLRYVGLVHMSMARMPLR